MRREDFSFWHALELLHLPKVCGRIEDGERCLEDCATIMPALKVFTTNMASMMELRDKFCALAALCGHIEGNETNSLLITEV